MRDVTSSETASRAASAASGERSFRRSLLAMLGLSTVVMMVAIDQTVVATALPTIVAELKNFDLYAWVATAYLLTSVITVPIFGRLGDWYGRKRLIVVAISLFTVASALCGAAGDMRELIAFRALQGIGGGMLVGTCFASIPDLFPDPVVRLRWQVLFSSAFGLANALGPSLGGFLSVHYGWRSAFFVNIPVGIASLYLTFAHLPDVRHQPAGKLSPDWAGALLIALTLGGLQALIDSLGQSGGWLRSSTLAAAVAVGGVLLARVESRALQPVIPGVLVRDRAMVVLLLLSMLMGMAMFTLLLYVPLLLQGGMGIGAEQAGVMITPLVVCITVGTVLNTRIVMRLRNPNALLYAGFALLGVACAGIALTGWHAQPVPLFVAMAAGGVGIGLVMPNLTVFAQQVAGKLHLGIATAMVQSTRMVGGMVGTAASGAAIDMLYRLNMGVALAASGQRRHVSPGLLHDPQALMKSHAAQRLLSPGPNPAGVVDGSTIVTIARASLSHAVSDALLAMMLLMLVACVLVRLVPAIPITVLGRRGRGGPD